MKFTLGLCDYLEQYSINKEKEHTHCPVCYEQVLTYNTESDMRHVLMCYKEELLLNTLTKHFEQHGTYPRITGEFIDQVLSRVAEELVGYCELHQTSLDLLGH